MTSDVSTDSQDSRQDPLWIFTYGALMWDPVFSFEEKVLGKAIGFSRSFCIQSKVWRGTPERPGLVAGLAPGGFCMGYVYRIPRDEVSAALDEADRRELLRDVYYRKAIEVELQDGRRIFAQAYIANLDSKEYRSYSLEEKVELIRTAVGPEGSSADYLKGIREKLADLGIQDPVVEEMYAQVFAL